MSKASSNLLSVIAIAMSLIALAGQLQHAPNPANAFSISSSSAAPDVYQPTSGTNVFNYQGILRKADGTLATGIYSMTFGLYDSPAGGNNLQYTESFSDVPVRDGLFNVLLGDKVSIGDSIVRTSPIFLGIRVGNEPEMAPRQRIHAVPRALTADGLAYGSQTIKSPDGSAWIGFTVNNSNVGGNSHIQSEVGPLFLNPYYSNGGHPHDVYVGGSGAGPVTLRVEGPAYVSNALTVNGGATISGGATVTGDMTLNDKLRTKGNNHPVFSQKFPMNGQSRVLTSISTSDYLCWIAGFAFIRGSTFPNGLKGYAALEGAVRGQYDIVAEMFGANQDYVDLVCISRQFTD